MPFTGGLFVAAGDVNSDGVADIILTSGVGGDTAVRAFNGRTLAPLLQLTAYPSAPALVPILGRLLTDAATSRRLRTLICFSGGSRRMDFSVVPCPSIPSVLEPQWTGEIDGEVQNDDTVKTIQYVELGGVVLDAEGNILGGGTGFAVATLPPAARMAMKISNGVSPIPYAKAASAIVSIVPHYAQQTP